VAPVGNALSQALKANDSVDEALTHSIPRADNNSPPQAEVVDVQTNNASYQTNEHQSVDLSLATASPAASTPSVAPTAIAVTLSGNNEWGELVEQTQLIGLSKELAMHCACEKLSDEKVVLSLAPASQHLFKSERVSEIQAGLQAVMNKPQLQVTLEVEESDKETPAECLKRLGYEQLEQTKSSIKNDPGVKALMSEFGATLNEQSIKPA